MMRCWPRILVVEDRVDTAEALALLLELFIENLPGPDLGSRGEVAAAFDRNMAMRLLQEGPFDFVIADFGLEYRGDEYAGGDELIMDIRRGATFDGNHGTPPDVPIVLLSGAYNGVDQCSQYGADFFMPKPASIDELTALISTVLRLPPRRRGTESNGYIETNGA